MNTKCVNKQPNASNCFVCGTENGKGLGLSFYDDGEALVETRFTLSDDFQGYPGVCHGGILAAILDEVVGRVAMISDHHRFMMTVNMRVQYRNPVPTKTALRAEGKVIKLRGRLCKAEGKIFLPDGRVGCEAELTLADMPPELANDQVLDQLGWRIVQD